MPDGVPSGIDLMTRVAVPVALPPARFPRTGAFAQKVRGPFQRHPWAVEVLIFATALVVYQLSRALVVGKPSTAFENAAGIINWEKGSGLFVETSIQQRVLNHIQVAEALNYFYLYGHWTITPLFFIWLYKRRRRVYPYVRNAFLVANAIALGVFMIYPVAPPRLAGAGDGFVDTLNKISNIDLHGGAFSGWFNPHAAVPSMHFGYAIMIGMVGLVLLRSWPLRLLAVAYPAVVFITITGTANHYVIDSLAGGLVVAVGFVGVFAWMTARGTLRPTEGRIRRTP
jgi:hypothetical protein